MKLQVHEEQEFNIPKILCCLIHLMSVFGPIFKVFQKH